MTRLKIHHLSEGGVLQETIADKVGVSVRSVQRILTEPKPTAEEISADLLVGRCRPGRPSVTRRFEGQIRALLAEQLDLRTIEILRRSREWGYQGSRSALFDFVRTIRPPKTTQPMVRFEGLPGEFAQFDFGEARVRFADGRRRKVTFFVGRLKFSRFLHVVLCPDQKAETLIRALIACLIAFGGAPKEWVFDNPATVRVSAPGEPIAFHPHLRDLAAELNVLPTLCTPRAANQKGSVENGVGFVKKGFLFARTFRDEADLAAQLAQWLEEVNTVRPCAATGEIPTTLLAQELPWLARRPVRFTAANYPLRESAVITPMATVRFRGTSYTASPRRIGATATLLVRQDTIEIVVDDERCVHARDDFSDRVVRLPAHNQEALKVIHGQRKKNYPLRESAVITPMATVRFRGTSYTASPRRIGATATLLVRQDTLEIVVDDERCVHARDDFSDRVVRLPAHNQEALKAIHGQRKKNYFRRQCLLELGPGAFAFLEQVVHRHSGSSWYPLVNALYELSQRHPRPAMDQALARCHAIGRYELNAVVTMLQEVA